MQIFDRRLAVYPPLRFASMLAAGARKRVREMANVPPQFQKANAARAAAPAAASAMTDPHLTAGADFHTVPIGDGKTIDLCPACYAEMAASVLKDAADALAANAKASPAATPAAATPPGA
jgi:hypothetical protein